MIKTESPVGTTPSAASLSSRIQEARSALQPQLQDAWKGAIQAAAAQTTVWSMKAGRAAVMAAFGLVGMALLGALFVAGFVLLDNALDYALARPDMPWFSPVVRGGVYFLVPLIVFLTVWYAAVGFGSAEKEEPAAAR